MIRVKDIREVFFDREDVNDAHAYYMKYACSGKKVSIMDTGEIIRVDVWTDQEYDDWRDVK